MRIPSTLVAGLLVGLGAATLAYQARWLASPDAAACRPPAQAMSRLELLFGMGRRQGGEIGEAEWRQFLDDEVTPRFPDGLTVLTGYGQWRNATGALAKETSRMLLVWSKPSPDREARIEAIRGAWKARFNQESVLRADGTSCVAF